MSSTLISNELQKDQRSRESIGLPNRAVVESVIPSEEKVQVETFGNVGTQKTSIRHPYLGVNSWIRVMPEKGTPLLTQQRGDYAQLEIFGYTSSNIANRHKVNQKGSTKKFLFRELQEGELEFMSSGRAYSHYADTGDVQLRGGTITLNLEQTQFQMVQQSPTYQRQLHLYDPAQLEHVERFGLVRRPDPANPAIILKYIRNTDQSFAMEHSRWLNKKDGSPLVSLQEGDIFDLQGNEIKHPTTNRPLRVAKDWYDDQGQALTFKIDESLNILIANTPTSTETTIKLGAKNVLDVSAKQLKMTFLSTGTMSFNNTLQIRASKLNAVAPQVNLGSAAAAFPVALATPMTTGFMSPLVSTLTAAFQALAATPAIVATPAAAAAMTTAANTIAGLSGAFASIPSTVVKTSG